METLNLPPCNFSFTEMNGKNYIFDEIRRKNVLLTPEEWVRQHVVQYLVKFKKYPSGLISLEKSFMQNKISRRSDVIVYNRSGEPLMLIECKAPNVEISQSVFDQAAAYNLVVKAPVLIVSNGKCHFCFKKAKDQQWQFFEKIPDYNDLECLRIE